MQKLVLDVVSPNAVVCERSSNDGVDVVAQRAAALQDIGLQLEQQREGKVAAKTGGVGTRLRGKQTAGQQHTGKASNQARKVAVSTGNAMVNQFKPWYYGVAFAFAFSFGTGMPDYAAFQEKERYRRTESAPRVEHAEWDKIMARRVEGQLVRDWQLGFVSWLVVSKPP